MTSSITRRDALERTGLLLALGLAGAGVASPVAGQSTATDGAASAATADDPWTRLYQGTAAVTITYLTDFDRLVSGEFDVDVRLGDTASVDTDAAPFQFDIRTGDMLSGNFFVQTIDLPYSPTQTMIEGTTTLVSEQDLQFEGLQRYWDFSYDAATGAVEGQFLKGDIASGNSIYKIAYFLNDVTIDIVYLSTRSRVAGTVTNERVDLRFDILDANLTIAASVVVSADRVA